MKPNRALALLLVTVLSLSTALLLVPPAAARPAAPAFTVQYIDHSYEVPPVYGKDPYTGATIVQQSGYHVDNRTIDVTITSQPFTPYLNADNHTIGLYYNVRSKGHFEEWTDAGANRYSQNYLKASDTAYTIVSFNIGNWQISPGGQIDFEVQAILGYPAADSSYCGQARFTETDQSGWSSAQTITIGEPATTTPTPPPYNWPNPTQAPIPTATPDQYQISPTDKPEGQTGTLFGLSADWEQTALIVMAVLIGVLAVALAVVLWRRLGTR